MAGLDLDHLAWLQREGGLLDATSAMLEPLARASTRQGRASLRGDAGTLEAIARSSYPLLLSDYMHKAMLREYAQQSFLWKMIATPKTVTDFKNWHFFRVGEFPNLAYAAPFALGAMLIAVLLNVEIAAMYSVVFSIITGIMLDNQLKFFIYPFMSSIVAAQQVVLCKERSTLIRAGFVAGVVNIVLILCFSIVKRNFLQPEMLFDLELRLSGRRPYRHYRHRPCPAH